MRNAECNCLVSRNENKQIFLSKSHWGKTLLDMNSTVKSTNHQIIWKSYGTRKHLQRTGGFVGDINGLAYPSLKLYWRFSMIPFSKRRNCSVLLLICLWLYSWYLYLHLFQLVCASHATCTGGDKYIQQQWTHSAVWAAGRALVHVQAPGMWCWEVQRLQISLCPAKFPWGFQHHAQGYISLPRAGSAPAKPGHSRADRLITNR